MIIKIEFQSLMIMKKYTQINYSTLLITIIDKIKYILLLLDYAEHAYTFFVYPI